MSGCQGFGGAGVVNHKGAALEFLGDGIFCITLSARDMMIPNLADTDFTAQGRLYEHRQILKNPTRMTNTQNQPGWLQDPRL